MNKVLNQDFSRKIVIVINGALPLWQTVNAVSHIAAYIGNSLSTQFSTGDYFYLKDNSKIARNSQYPIIVLSGSAEQIKKLQEQLKESALVYMPFIKEMIQTTNDAEIIDQLAQKSSDEIEYLGVGIFGLNNEVDALTQSLDLFKTVKVESTSGSARYLFPESPEYQLRKEKVFALQQVGIPAWSSVRPVDFTCQQVRELFQEGQELAHVVAGRVRTWREHGKTIFAHIQDSSGLLQIYIRQDIIGDQAFAFINSYINVGDIIWCSGTSFRTKMGEITLKISELVLLSKCLHPLPEKFHGLIDIETIYRQRYLDLITNQESKDRFIKRSRIVQTIRHFLDEHGFLEVETPMLHPIPGGAAARPFITHHNALNSDFYLRIAPELYLKRLIIGGFERVYEINRNFRNEGISTRHNPEFTMVEFYMAHHDFIFAMDFVEQLLQYLVQRTHKAVHVTYADIVIDFEKAFERLSLKDAIVKYSQYSHYDIEEPHIDSILDVYTIVMPQASYGQKLFALFEKFVEHQLMQPTFIVDYPIEISPLSERNIHNPAIANRFELFIAGMEISNGFNELNDPFDQAQRFKQQAEAHTEGDFEAHHYDADYIRALEYGLPPTVGVGIGVDRLVMLLTNALSIKDVILFPTLKKR